MLDDGIRAMVQTAARTFELRELERPEIGEDQALIRVEACGVCGSDVSMYKARSSGTTGPNEYPIIRGHEPVGRVEVIGTRMADRAHLQPGDRVAVDPFMRCGICRYCLGGRGELCTGGGTRRHNAYGTIPLRVEPGLWGGFATHLVATNQTILYPVPEHVPPNRAALFNILGAAIKWGVDVAGTGLGSSVVVLGCGQRGLACAIAALEAGAEFVAVTGLAKDAFKLTLGQELGVHLAVDIEHQDVKAEILARFDLGVDIVIDTTPGSTEAVSDAVAMVRPGGKVVLGGLKGRAADRFPLDEITHKEVVLQGVLGTGSDHYRRALAMIARTKLPLERLQTHLLPLEDVAYGIQLLGGEIPNEQPLNVVIDTA